MSNRPSNIADCSTKQLHELREELRAIAKGHRWEDLQCQLDALAAQTDRDRLVAALEMYNAAIIRRQVETPGRSWGDDVKKITPPVPRKSPHIESPTQEACSAASTQSEQRMHHEHNLPSAQFPAAIQQASSCKGLAQKPSDALPAVSIVIASAELPHFLLLPESERKSVSLAVEALDIVIHKSCHPTADHTKLILSANPPPSAALRRAKGLLRAALSQLGTISSLEESKGSFSSLPSTEPTTPVK
jgi:hypothetical protein